MRIRIINANTSAAMTDKMGVAALNAARPGTEIIAVNPASGPLTIESHFDETVAAVGVCEEIRAGEVAGTDAYVIACFGDPGLYAARELTNAPVIGIAEAAFHVASLIATRFSVVTTLGRTGIMAERLLHEYGMGIRCRKVRAAEIPVLALEHQADEAFRLIEAECIRARDEDNIGAIVLGCGGMADLAGRLSASMGMPVVEGVAAAVALAESLVTLKLQTSKFGDLAAPPAKPFTGEFARYSR